MSATITKVILSLIAAGILFAQPLAGQTYLFDRTSLPTGKGPSAAIAADFNRDGKQDLAVANFQDNTVSVITGTGHGTFAPQAVYATGTSPCALVADDFNRDGRPDLGVLNCNSKTVSVLLGNGDSTFQSHLEYAVGNHPEKIIAADFDGDRHVDLAILNQDDNTISVLYGVGDGSFEAQVAIAVGSSPLALSAGDFNGDGRTDLITTNRWDASVTVLLSNGRVFTRTDLFPGIGREESSVAVLDFSRDGKPDAVVLDAGNSMLLLQGNGDGTFQAPVKIGRFPGLASSLRTADFNGDGIADLTGVAKNGFVVLKGKKDGGFEEPVLITTDLTPEVMTDLNQDGIPDFVTSYSNWNAVGITLGNADGSYSPVVSLPFGPTRSGVNSAVAADFNGDGKLDLALALGAYLLAPGDYPTGRISVRLGNGDGTFQDTVTSPVLSSLTNNGDLLLTGDFNGDGKVDLLVVDDYSHGFQILLGKGDGSFQAPIDTVQSTGSLGSIVVRDFNNDGRSDLLVRGSSLQVYLSKGDGSFQPGTTIAAKMYSEFSVDDFNRDGDADIVLAGTREPLWVYLGNGDGTFREPISGPTLDTSGPIIVADLNGDHQPDLWTQYIEQAFIPGNGDGTFQEPVYSRPVLPVAYTADFDGDGRLDMAGPAANGGAVIRLGNGDGTFGPPLYYPGSGTGAFVVGDFDSDGRIDLAIPTYGSNQVSSIVTLHLSGVPVAQPDFQIVSTPQSAQWGGGIEVSDRNITATVAAGGYAGYSVTILPFNGFRGTVNFTCSGLPAGTSCEVRPVSVAITGTSSVQVSILVSTTALPVNAAGTSPVLPNRSRRFFPSFAGVLLFGSLIIGVGARQTHKVRNGTGLLVLFVLGLVSCGGGGSGSNSGPSTPAAPTVTPAGPYKIALTGTSGSLTRKIDLTLTVQ